MSTQSRSKRLELQVAGVLILVSFCEVGVTVLFTRYLGALLTYSLFAIPTTVGLFIQWQRKLIAAAAWRKVGQEFQKGNTYEARMLRTRPHFVSTSVEVASYWIATFLFFIPGPLTVLIAFSLTLPIVRNLLSKRLMKDAKRERRELQEWKRQQPPTERISETIPATNTRNEKKKNRNRGKRRRD